MLEPVDQQYVMIGYIAQAHGVDGTVLMIPEHYAPELFDEIELVRLQGASGDLVPARVESVRAQEKNNRLSFFVKFDHITDRNEAEALKNNRVYVANDKVGDLIEEESAVSLASYEVRDEHDVAIGVVDHLLDSPAHPVLVVEADSQQLLIPFVDEYIELTDEENAIIYCKNLDQLMNIE